jgi:uncharacterized membrane protein YeaQ/YmgE (transglycosylase-associated protein family)
MVQHEAPQEGAHFMDLIILIVIGAIVGWLGRLVAGRDVNLLLTILIGIVGVYLGFYIWDRIGDGSKPIGYVIGVLVSAGLVILVTRMSGRSRRS